MSTVGKPPQTTKVSPGFRRMLVKALARLRKREGSKLAKQLRP
jgi:hypothetical protein